MSAVVDLDRARSRRQQRPVSGSRADLGQALSGSLQALYRPLASGVADTMRPALRTWLDCRARRHGVDEPGLQRFVAGHRMGLSVTISTAQHDATAAQLLAPELLIALLALDRYPDALRADWPEDRRDLDALADVFGRPFAG